MKYYANEEGVVYFGDKINPDDKDVTQEQETIGLEQSYNGNWYLKGHAPQQSVEELKALKNDEINTWREKSRQDEYAIYEDNEYGIREGDQSNINSQVAIAQLMLQEIIPTQSQPLRDVANITHEFSPQEIIAVGLSIGQKITQVYNHSWELKEQVENATTKEQLDEITW